MRKSEFIYKLGRRIAQLRKEKKLSQEAFAELTGISQKRFLILKTAVLIQVSKYWK